MINTSPPAGERIDVTTPQSCYWGVFYGFGLAPIRGYRLASVSWEIGPVKEGGDHGTFGHPGHSGWKHLVAVVC